MQINIIDKITKFLNWFIDFLAKPLGIATWSIVLIIAGVYYGEYKENRQNEADQIQITANGVRIKHLEGKIDTLSNRLANRDCSDEIQKYVDVIQNIQTQTSQKKEEIQRRLELERQKTEELKTLKQTLNAK